MTAGSDVRHEGPHLARVGQLQLQLCHDAFGEPDDPVMLLVMGLGFQLVHWPEELCRLLARSGFRVVRFDNRDAGASSHLPGQAYRLEDMADDALGLLDVLGVRAAHVVGASMGGMVAQVLAVEHPERVLSLASLRSTTGRRGVGRTSPRVWRHARGRRPQTVEQAVERRVRVFATVGSTTLQQDVSWLRQVNTLAYTRDPDSAGGRRRQHRAVRSASDRTHALRRLDVPAVVVHGTVDRLCAPSGGRATAAAIPGTVLELVEGMGHDLPPDAWPRLVRVITENAHRGRRRG